MSGAMNLHLADRPAAILQVRAAAEIRAAPELTIVVPTLNKRDGAGGALMGVVWNYLITSVFGWRSR
jgi:hypothetical protein